jgi:hypothetical protein
MTAELNSKLISRSIFGFELAIDAIWSRSSVDSERVGRLRNAPCLVRGPRCVGGRRRQAA